MGYNGKLAKGWLKRLNQRSGKQWSLGELRQLGAGISASDLQNDQKAMEIVKRVAKAAGKDISNEKARELVQKLRKSNAVNNELKK